MTTARERVGWALLFGVPVGAGVALATARMARAPPADPLVLGAGGAAALLVALFVAAAATTGSEA